MRQQVLPSLVSQEDSASMSLLSNSLSTWGNPSTRPIRSLFSLSRGRSVPPLCWSEASGGTARAAEGPCSSQPVANIQRFCSGGGRTRFPAQRAVCAGAEGLAQSTAWPPESKTGLVLCVRLKSWYQYRPLQRTVCSHIMWMQGGHWISPDL